MDVTSEGKSRIEQWLHVQEQISSLKKELSRAECAALNAQNSLGRWLCPEDARIGESFCVWFGDSLIQATKQDGSGLGDFEVKIRKRGRSLRYD